jgi:hypothetical protein
MHAQLKCFALHQIITRNLSLADNGREFIMEIPHTFGLESTPKIVAFLRNGGLWEPRDALERPNHAGEGLHWKLDDLSMIYHICSTIAQYNP